MAKSGGAAATAARTLQVLDRDSFGPTDFFELLDVVRENSSEYDALSASVGKVSKKLEDFADEERDLRRAAVNVALGYSREALRLLEESDSRMSLLIRARAHQQIDEQTKAIRCYTQSAEKADETTVAERVFLSQCLCFNGRPDEAEKTYKSLSKDEKAMFDARILDALIRESNGDLEKAIEKLDKIIADFDGAPEAIFRKAFILDQRGADVSQVEELYKKLVAEERFHEGAAVNLSLIFIDEGRYDEAEKLLNDILRYAPDNDRVWLYLRDVQASRNMFYDEGRRREDEKLRQILRLPISEFELSVRSRNCLARMNVHTLGDLISKTEAELLAYKNFGETSLKEIKDILARKGLGLGMKRDEVERKMRSPSQRLAALTVSDNILEQPLSALSLSVRSQKCLESEGIKTVQELVEMPERELLTFKNFGLTSLTEVKKKLASYGLELEEE
ncbi:MAG: DNA-directed RNA polymerase subunit alpha C-terminal domain-containing protein [Planctomycetota bacterium]|nr:DNA-directed RNA polymerase subunit alpha C-terminal domain-containing protein [Planctomycetota bacterium]